MQLDEEVGPQGEVLVAGSKFNHMLLLSDDVQIPTKEQPWQRPPDVKAERKRKTGKVLDPFRFFCMVDSPNKPPTL
ncbi:hypothetical protein J31TS4_31480 [Paenibacillus sp. J31TS4]|uniref:hypothetical protein n=1 Tax=Paenibacillus sp. J31TS4 TaxID=2807195 RepID=UPI001B0ED5FA|nr:hypothetical protein [Paenibacillus sp. J31TS4]GIP39868.1 hypothetical protein J31TS4_31480 [Paenibacillus sp. J31TS4]